METTLNPALIQAARESNAHVKAMFGRRDYTARHRNDFPELFETEGEARAALAGFKVMNPRASGYVARANCDETGFRVYVSNGGISFAL